MSIQKRHLIAAALLLALLLTLSAAVAVSEGYAAAGFFRDQLDADERAVYDALAAASPGETQDPVTVWVPMPEPTSRYSSTDFVYAAYYAFRYDRPAEAAWISSLDIRDQNGREIPFEELMVGTPDRLHDYSALLIDICPACTRSELNAALETIAGMTAGISGGMSRYERASLISGRVSSALRYDHQRLFDVSLTSSPLCVRCGYAICEGFAKVFKIMADRVDLPCVLSGGSTHMCVQVQMEDGGWYIVDPEAGLLLAGLDQVQGNPMYVPQVGAAHFMAQEGHGSLNMPPIPSRGYVAGTGGSIVSPVPADNGEMPMEMGVPQLNGRRFGAGSMNVVVYWVQVQMKATGVYYTGDEWDETGSLGDHTREEIRRFMADRGYPGHDGCVDQSVVDELAAYLGSRLRPVMSGGWYGRMGTLLDDTVWQSMTRLTPSGSRGSAVRWVQTALRMLGYYNGSVDGVFGPATVRAVHAFQKDHGYLERDYVSYGVARAMLEACHDRGCDLSQLP